jgi:soluble lytic murein transglycosylase-like protein
MMIRALRLLAVAAGLAAPLAALALPRDARADEEAYSGLCEAAIFAGARRGGVPVEVLHAIALTETGRNANGRMRPWPWAINREGEGFWFKSRDEALAFARNSIAAGRPSFDVGCVQINYRWHGRAFPSIEAMLDPEWTATYAAQFLRTLYQERGSWSEAAGAYHSLTPELAGRYRERFDRLLASLEPIDPAAVAALPDRGSTRAERRAAARAAAAARLAAMGPPPEPGMGSLAAGIMVPAAGGLLVRGNPLLSPGGPLLSQPGAGLF